MICLDTNAVIALLSGRASPVRAHFEIELGRGQAFAVSTIVLYELWYGSSNSQRQVGNAHKLEAFVSSPVEALPFEPEDAREAGDIRAALNRAGTPIGPYDILIAAQARRRNAVLVTANMREFARVPGLKCEDWSA
ncbi:MAG: type II toxin-antitoxin system VapC family toxin [Bauldia sp.]